MCVCACGCGCVGAHMRASGVALVGHGEEARREERDWGTRMEEGEEGQWEMNKERGEKMGG